MAKEELDEEIVIADSEQEGGDDVIIEPLEDETNSDDSEELDEDIIIVEEKPKFDNKTILLISSVIIVFLIVAIVLILLLIKKSKKPTPQNTSQIVRQIQKKEAFNTFTPSKIDRMIKQANVLYESGNKMEALNLYENIASYNEAISQYNIGVAKMKEHDFKGGLQAFKNAILNKEKRTVSAINAAVCALRLKDMPLFKYYLDLAYTYLPEESNAPLYSYYIGLVNFYKQNYYEALNALKNPSSSSYKKEQDYLASKIFSYLNNNHEALNNTKDDFAQALLYARIGEFSLSKNKLLKASYKHKKQVSLALALVELKLGNFSHSATLLRDSFEENATYVNTTYPIKATLNKGLFDVNEAQNDFKKSKFFNKNDAYAMLFYFAPYKVFNAKQTIDLIRKGGMNVFVDDIGTGLEYLKESSTISKINVSLTDGIKLALNHHYMQANEKFKSLVKIYTKHSILHYNLALSYAQIGNYSLAYKHFKTSYRLDNKNYLAGLFAVMNAHLVGQNNAKLLEEIRKDLLEDTSLEKINFFMTLSDFINNNQFSMNRWLEEDKDDSPLHLVFDIITANWVSNSKAYTQKASKLKKLLPKDMLANIIAFNAKYSNKNIKQYAKMVQIEFKDYDFNQNAFYYGSMAVKEQYIKMLQISGLLHKKREDLQKRLKLEQKDPIGIMNALAYLDIYTNNFEQAYILYNTLIDNHNQQDSNTIFLAAVASIGANHHENAIALLELAKLNDPNNLESRYALGLLYQQMKNFKAATTQYQNIGNSGFRSKYFSFDIMQ